MDGHEGAVVDRPENLTGASRHFSSEDVFWIASQFDLPGLDLVEEFGARGNINLHTYLVRDSQGEEHILQRINTDVFRQPFRVMASMTEWIGAQRRYLESGRAPAWTIWEPISLVRTRDGDSWLDLSDAQGFSVWRMMRRIGNSVCYKSLSQAGGKADQLRLAEELGRGLALNADFTADVPVSQLASSLPGYRDTAGYFSQFESITKGTRHLDDVVELPWNEEVRDSTQHLYVLAIPDEEARRRQETVLEYIEIARRNAAFAISLQARANEGSIRKVAIHGDTKIENFLFCAETGRVRSLVDLDTIMPYTWLADWGDMLRSLVNVAGECEPDLEKIQVDEDVYQAVAKGFLATIREASEEELDLLHDAIKAIALELGVRFLTDYLRGDNYFMLGKGDPHDLNRTRGMVQLTLFQRLAEKDAWAKEMLDNLRSKKPA